jgi:hypothetical protein
MDKIKNRIRKLLAVAGDSGATEGEINNAVRFAQQMMDAHHLTEADLATSPEEQWEGVENARCDQAFSIVGGRLHRWEGDLAMFVQKFVGGIKCYVTTSPRPIGGKFKRAVGFAGLAEDAVMAKELYDEMRMTIIAMAKLSYKSVFMGDGGMYCEGFVAGLQMRFTEERRKANLEAQSSSREMVLIDRRNDLIKRKLSRTNQFLASQGMRLRSGSRRSGANGSHSAYSQGVADGKSQSVTRTQRRKITS